MHAVRPTIAAGLFLSLVLAACSGGAAPTPSPTRQPTEPPPTQVPGGASPGAPSAPGNGTVTKPGGGGSDPGNPGGDFTVPAPGTTVNPRDVAIQLLEVRVDGRAVSVIAHWTSGVEPCYVLDTVSAKKDGNEFTVSLTEGSGDADAMCIEIAQEKRTLIDLGELEPGDYVVAANGETAPAVPFTVS